MNTCMKSQNLKIQAVSVGDWFCAPLQRVLLDFLCPHNPAAVNRSSVTKEPTCFRLPSDLFRAKSVNALTPRAGQSGNKPRTAEMVSPSVPWP